MPTNAECCLTWPLLIPALLPVPSSPALLRSPHPHGFRRPAPAARYDICHVLPQYSVATNTVQRRESLALLLLHVRSLQVALVLPPRTTRQAQAQAPTSEHQGLPRAISPEHGSGHAVPTSAVPPVDGTAGSAEQGRQEPGGAAFWDPDSQCLIRQEPKVGVAQVRIGKAFVLLLVIAPSQCPHDWACRWP